LIFVSTLRLIPLDDTVVFPGMSITLTVAVGDDERVVLVPRHEGEYAEVGVVAAVAEHVRLPGGGHAVNVEAEHRALVGAAQTGSDGALFVEVDERRDEVPVDARTRTLSREYRACWPTPAATAPTSPTSSASSCCGRST
jgi:ATP-dependent Lon protease